MNTKENKQNKDNGKNDPLGTPVMRQYLEIKDRYPDAILLFRMGDFYELFLDDAKIAAPLMDVALTARQGGVPMAGVPYHSADSYIARLLSAGKKVAVAEQETDPNNPKLMSRRVRRVLTPGTLVEESLLRSSDHNYLMALTPVGNRMGAALADVSTGDFFSTEIRIPEDGKDCARSERFRAAVRDLFSRYTPGEILVPSDLFACFKEILPGAAGFIVGQEPWKASPSEGGRRIASTHGVNLKGLGYDDDTSPALGAVSMIIHYVTESFPGSKIELDPPVMRIFGADTVILDEQTVRNLDLTQNSQEGGVERTLFKVLDACRSTPGKRYLKESILSPLADIEQIVARQNSVELFLSDRILHDDLIDNLSSVADLERVMTRIVSGRGVPRDFRSIRETVAAAIRIGDLLSGKKECGLLSELEWVANPLKEFTHRINDLVVDDPPAIMGNAPFIVSGVDGDLDKAREAKEKGTRWILDFETEEKSRTGIQNLKVKYNRVVGYFIEVSKVQSGKVPEDYVRRQTLVNAERYSCPRLEDLEQTIMGAEQKIDEIERRLFNELCESVSALQRHVKEMMRSLATADFLSSLAIVSARHGWIRPTMVESGELVIEDGRHPVVEAYLSPGENFIPNNLMMDCDDRSFGILTGPNMAGKSTYIRQAAIIQILSQIGSRIPAKSAIISVADNIFTRIGAGDNLTRGESTFFVEMLETARILNRCTDRSLIIMDEVGRGTSTYDGLSIAWAVVEHLADMEKPPKTLFATHYHELTSLENRHGIFNLTMDVREAAGKVVFLHKVREGAADDSYGIHVARLAGLPESVIGRAEEKLRELEEDMSAKKIKKEPGEGRKQKKSAKDRIQPSLF